MPPKKKLATPRSSSSQFNPQTLALLDDDDDFQKPSLFLSLTQNPSSKPLKLSNGVRSSFKKPRRSIAAGKENAGIKSVLNPALSSALNKSCTSTSNEFAVSELLTDACGNFRVEEGFLGDTRLDEDVICSQINVDVVCSQFNGDNGLDSIESSTTNSYVVDDSRSALRDFEAGISAENREEKGLFELDEGNFSNCIESSLTEPSSELNPSIEKAKHSIESSLTESLSELHPSIEKATQCIESSLAESLSDLHPSIEKVKQCAESAVVAFEERRGQEEKSKFTCKGDDIFDLKMGVKSKRGYLTNSIESRLLAATVNCSSSDHDSQSDEDASMDFEPGEDLDILMKLCSDEGDGDSLNSERNGLLDGLVQCPVCRFDISHLNAQEQLLHTNDCLDRDENQKDLPFCDITRPGSAQRVVDMSPVLLWLQSLGLTRYQETFVKEEIDWDSLQWLTEEDLISMGVTTLGPRKKIVHALKELRKGRTNANHGSGDASKVSADENRKLAGNKLITEFFPGSSAVDRNRGCQRSLAENSLEKRRMGPASKNTSKVINKDCHNSVTEQGLESRKTVSGRKKNPARNRLRNGTVKDIPSWCCIPGTPFRVDAFRYLRRDCSYWFLTHFHMDHYQGLTRSFCHGKIYCSSITAHLVNMKIGIPWDSIQVLPINQKINIAGVDVTCLDANHCPGAIIILFEPPNGKAVLHTGDFRFGDEMANSFALKSCAVHTLILDTTYCDPQYDFPKQEAVIQFVIEAIQAEAFNPKTLFLIGSYTIGKERLFVEVARCLQKKVYVGAAKLRLLQCLGLPEEDMKWFTPNEKESYIHVVPMWTIASFKRMKHITNQYMGRFNLIIAFSPTGWSFGKGKKKSQGRRWEQGTIIRYEVPYSEHSSFTELKEFVQLVSPENIIPSVNNEGPESAATMVSLLVS